MPVSKEIISLKIRASGVVPVFYHPDMDVLLRVVSISYQSGLRVFEFMHQRDNKGLRFFEHLAGRLEEFPDLTLGVGTVLDATMTERYIKAGANFVASPFLRPDMGQVARDYNIPWMPGCTALVEIEKAKDLGASFINVLPGNVLGFEFITPIAKQYPELNLIPSGIADLREVSLMKWFESGVCGIKLGPQVFTKEDITAKDWSRITNNLKDLLSSIKRIQSSLKLDSVPE
jgi:2-dehydro-3-deoxyphosphogluconate aldolase / (4S)-4-hydroxy-2-oxoglutarate aldolase